MTKAKPKKEVVKAEPKIKVVKGTKAKPHVEVKAEAQPKPKKKATKPVEAPQPSEAPVTPPKAEKKPTEPVRGKKYIFTSGAGEFIASINGTNDKGYDLMTIHEVVGGCQSERTIPVPEVGAFQFHEDDKEIFRRLSQA